jgi:hypothetical protein
MIPPNASVIPQKVVNLGSFAISCHYKILDKYMFYDLK